jgi:hypothetical protein
MATDYAVTQDQIIQAAMRQCGALDQSALPGSNDYNNVGMALQLLLKEWVADGIPLWKVATLTLPMVANQATYYMGATGPDLITDRPLRVLEAEIQNTISLQSIQLWSISREQYVELSGKAISFGIPTQYWFEPLGSELSSTSARITFYPIPFAGITQQVLLKALQPLQNPVALTDVIDFPAEYYLPFKWCLAYEIANEYPVSDSRYARIRERAMASKEKIIEWGQEQDVEMRIKYDRRGR